jgi:hypothetical protein
MDRLKLSLFCLLVLTNPALAQAVAGQDSPCEQAGHDAEREYALPVGLLDAIGRVESGRWNPMLGRTVPSPWAIDAAGQPLLSGDKATALQQVRALQDRGNNNIDVGCFQINLRSHPTAFSNLDQAFDPVENAQYAARFLASLHARLGNWQDAVAAYHSTTPERGVPYQQAVYANWSTSEGWQQAFAAAPSVAHKTDQPMTVFAIDGAVIRVWIPSASSSGARSAANSATTLPGLPRIITPGG